MGMYLHDGSRWRFCAVSNERCLYNLTIRANIVVAASTFEKLGKYSKSKVGLSKFSREKMNRVT